MTREWKPGDVAMVKFNSGHEALAISGTRDDGRRIDDCWRFGLGGVEWHDSARIDSARPFVVIDPEDREQVERLINAWYAEQGETGKAAHERMGDALREFANPTPPKPDEPMGLGAVVEDAEGEKWVRVPEAADDSQCWVMHEVGTWRTWSDITAVRILSEGFSDE